MAISYTTVFTVVGKYVKKINNYLTEVATLTTDQGDITTILTSQSVVRLNDGLGEVYDEFRSNVIGWINALIGRTADVITDPVLVTDQLPFGTTPDIQTTLATLIQDMAVNDKNVTTSTMTTGSVSKTSTNAHVGDLVLGTLLDGVNPPMSGATPNIAYSGLTSLMYPDDETITATCIVDSEHGSALGGEQFSIAGTGQQTPAYSVGGENLGQGPTVTVGDLSQQVYGTNFNLDSYGTDHLPVGWTDGGGGGVAGTDYGSPDDLGLAYADLFGNTDTTIGSSLIGKNTGNAMVLLQTLNTNLFERNRAYFLSFWCKRHSNAGTAPHVTVEIDGNSSSLLSVVASPSSTANWTHYNGQFIIPEQLTDLSITISSTLDAGEDIIQIDQIVITPAVYVAGVALAIFQGPTKFIQGDKFVFELSNDNAGKFLTYFRRAFLVQLPIDATPTISDSLVA